jgi:hypothetical protein
MHSRQLQAVLQQQSQQRQLKKDNILNIFYLEPRCLQRGSLVLPNKINICLLRQLVFLIAVMVGSLS